MNIIPDPRDLPAVPKTVNLDKVQVDRRTQARVRISYDRVAELAEVLRRPEDDFKDPVELYGDGEVYWIGDGFHRIEAYRKAGRHRARALVREGGWLAALTHALGANDAHGLPRSRKDLRRAIALALEHYPNVSNRAVAQLCRTSHPTVAAARQDLGLDADAREYTDKHGNRSVMDISGLRGKTAAAPGKVNEFHELPAPARKVIKDLFGEIGRLPKADAAFLATWLKANLPAAPKEALELLTRLEVEEGEGEALEGAGDKCPF
jgi:hypothetical protein